MAIVLTMVVREEERDELQAKARASGASSFSAWMRTQCGLPKLVDGRGKKKGRRPRMRQETLFPGIASAELAPSSSASPIVPELVDALARVLEADTKRTA